MSRQHPTPAADAAPLRISAAAKATGCTPRALRYYDELGLLCPSVYGTGGERRYTDAEVARAAHIRELQELMGFSLAEIRVALQTEDSVAHVRGACADALETPGPESAGTGAHRGRLLDEAIAAHDELLATVDDKLARIRAFRGQVARQARALREHATQRPVVAGR